MLYVNKKKTVKFLFNTTTTTATTTTITIIK